MDVIVNKCNDGCVCFPVGGKAEKQGHQSIQDPLEDDCKTTFKQERNSTVRKISVSSFMNSYQFLVLLL